MKSQLYTLAVGLLIAAVCLLPAGIAAQMTAENPLTQFEMVDQLESRPMELASDLAALVAMLGVGLGMAYTLKDNALKKTKALPTGASTVSGDGFDLGHGSRGDFVANCELQIEAPALTTSELPDTQTIIYHVYHSDNSDFSGESLLYGNIITQTGAGGAGAAADTKQCRLPVDVKRYVRVKATKTGAANASTKSMTTRLVF